ncbi:MAG: DUF1800 domain-containing protein [Proteobacteria bacterium]|nr:DUF1800 domain-containing protein [Pseudomonadota bacterium]
MSKTVRIAPRWRRGLVLALAATTFFLDTAHAASKAYQPSSLLLIKPWISGTPADASRFLAQTTFGPTDADIQRLVKLGYLAWLDDQFAAPPTRMLDYLGWVKNTLGEDVDTNHVLEAWWLGALGGPDPGNNALIHRDQLRQRVAFALSEIFVVSTKTTLIDQFPNGQAYFYDVLVNDAFGNFRQLLEDVTLSPAMGVYLNMLSNQRTDSTKNIHPDENYAREVNQLFTVGLVLLNPDGTPQLSGGLPIPTYTQDTVKAFAHVFTGWNWADCNPAVHQNFSDCDVNWTTGANMQQPMAAFANYHDNGTRAPDDLSGKQLLNYPGAANAGLLVDGGTPQSDLKFALDNIFNHPNVGPFIGRQLIQRLVTSNPTPGYVQRIAAVFNDNGHGVRGDLKAVISAIVLDDEARNGAKKYPDSFGKLREPLLRMAHIWRAMGAQHRCGHNKVVTRSDKSVYTEHYAAQPYRYAGWYSAWSTDYLFNQRVMYANSVFNFFRPNFVPPGEMAQKNLYGPEFQITTDSQIAEVTNDVLPRAMWLDIRDTCDSTDDYGDVAIDHLRDLALAGSGQGGPADPADRLVDAYNVRFMGGQMSTYMRTTLLNYLNRIDHYWDNGGTQDWRIARIQRALYLILTSPEYAIQK